MTRLQLIEKASSYIEQEPYANPNKFTRWYFKDNKSHAWCGAFIDYVVKNDLGSDMLDSCSNFAYVPTIYRWAKEKGYFDSNFKNAKQGDLVIYNWTPTTVSYSHVGIVYSVGSDSITSIDGNTNNDYYTKNCVAKRTRNKKYIVGIVKLPYKEENMFNKGDTIECLVDTKLYTTVEKKESKYTIKKGDIAFVKLTYGNSFIALADTETLVYYPSAWTDEQNNFKLYEPDYKFLYEQEKELNKELQDKINKAIDDLK